jgi:RNA polymerase sigma-70 factor (ECF subfamily)
VASGASTGTPGDTLSCIDLRSPDRRPSAPMHPDPPTRLERARAGDLGALEELVVEHVPALRAFIRARAGAALRERESSSDLVQSACREVLADLASFEYRDDTAFRRWLYLAAERKIQDRVRHHARDRRDAAREQLLGDEDARVVDTYARFCTPSRIAIAREEMQRIERALDRLPATYRDVLRSRHVLGLTNAEIARDMQRTPEYVRMVLARAKSKLAQALDDEVT